jgi:integrase
MNPSCNRRFSARRAHAAVQRVCGSDPCRRWYKAHWTQTRRPPRGIGADAYAAVERACRDDAGRHALVVLARRTGLRKGELLGLTWGDVLDGSGRVRGSFAVRGQWDDARGFVPPKTRASRPAYIDREARSELERLAGGRTLRRSARIFPYWESAVHRWFVALQRRLGVGNLETGRPYRFHDFRHALATELVRAGRIDLARRMLGHRDLNTTMIYAEQGDQEVLADLESALGRGKRPSSA